MHVANRGFARCAWACALLLPLLGMLRASLGDGWVAPGSRPKKAVRATPVKIAEPQPPSSTSALHWRSPSETTESPDAEYAGIVRSDVADSPVAIVSPEASSVHLRANSAALADLAYQEGMHERSFTLQSADQWVGVLRRNTVPAPGVPHFMVVSETGGKRKYIRGSDSDLEPMLGHRVAVPVRSGLILNWADLQQNQRQDHSPGQLHLAEPVRPISPGYGHSDAHDHVHATQFVEELPAHTALDPVIVQEDGSISHGPLMIDPAPVAIAKPPAAAGCQNCQTKANGCACGARGRWWIRPEYLHWWTDGFFIPPLVSTSPTGTAQAEAGVIGEAGTAILFGNSVILDDSRSGGRLTIGRWMRGGDDVGIEGDYFQLDTESRRFQASGFNGSPILARPFFNMISAQEDAELVSFPNLIEGTVTVDATSDFESAGVRMRYAACCHPWADGVGTARIDFLLGYRGAELNEALRIREDLRSLSTASPGNFVVQDAFGTTNKFHGADVGFVWEWERARWSLELISRIALGTIEQNVDIQGNTVVSDGSGFEFSQTGGLLAQRSNIGNYERDKFSVLPELSARLAWRLTPALRVSMGYNLIYWSSIVRPGDQIDRDLNPNLLPPELDPLAGPLRPQFAFRETEFWAQGLSAGLDIRF